MTQREPYLEWIERVCAEGRAYGEAMRRTWPGGPEAFDRAYREVVAYWQSGPMLPVDEAR